LREQLSGWLTRPFVGELPSTPCGGCDPRFTPLAKSVSSLTGC
jgi:hypothetical protein